MNLRVEHHCLFASSWSRYFAVSWTLLSFWIGEIVCPTRDVKPVLELLDVVHHLLVDIMLHPTECGPRLWYSSRAVNLSHSSLAAGLQRRQCDNCVIRTGLVDSYSLMMTLFLMVVASSLAILACCRSAPAATTVLNAWNSVSCLKSPVVLVHHLGILRLVHTLLIRTLLLLMILQFFGIADVLSMHLFNLHFAHTHFNVVPA